MDFSTIQEPISKANNILVLITANPNLDQVAAALSLHLGLRKLGKNVIIACPTEMTVAFNRLIGVNKISSTIGNRNLTISFDYVEDSIEKVSYNIEDKKFNLVIEPKSNFPSLSTDKLKYSYSGLKADLIFIIGAGQLNDLQSFYDQEKNFFSDAFIVNIDNKSNNNNFGKVNFIDPNACCCSEIISKLIKNLNWQIDQDIATNLYAGISGGTSNFQSGNFGPDLFETVAWLLKMGAKKDHMLASPQPGSETISSQPAYEPKSNFSAPVGQFPAQQQTQLSPQPITNQAFNQVQQKDYQNQTLKQPQSFKPSVNSVSPTQPQNQSTQKLQDQAAGVNNRPKPPFSDQENQVKNDKPQPPPDWFKPKIFKSNQKL